ncbi:hypothetical protein ACFLRB_05410 [Acidobacteriota bacterium]
MIDRNLLLDRYKAVLLVEKLEFADLVVYIEERLRGISVLPAIDTRSDEMPEYFLEKLYEHSNIDEFKSKFRKAIATLLCQELLEISHPDYLAILLALCEEFIIEEATAPVSGLALSGKLKGINSNYGDLHRQVLMALARLSEGLKMTDIWVKDITDSRYTASAFAALREQGLETICKYLPQFLRMVNEQPDSLDMGFSIKTLYDNFQSEYSQEEITQFIFDCSENENEKIRKELISVLESIDKDFSLLKNILFKELTQKEVVPGNARKKIDLWQWIAEKENKPERAARWKGLLKNAA